MKIIIAENCGFCYGVKRAVEMALKTVKDKNGYTKLPGFKGTGVAQSTKAGYPIKHVYTPYETSLINLSKKEGVTDLTNSDTTVEDGLDF